MNRTGLLVSVRSGAEAADAVEAGADLIDVKEPRGGSLGAPSAQIVSEVLATVAGRRPVSVALGELIDHCTADCDLEDRPSFGSKLDPRSLDTAICFAKLGLAECAGKAAWENAWQLALDQLPSTTAAVAVMYADWPVARSPAPDLVIAAARRLDCRAVLVDTFDKAGPGLLRLWALAELQALVDTVRDSGMLVVLAGKLLPADFDQLLPLEPDFLAVRGAVCHSDRTARLDPARVRTLSARLRSVASF